jgi:hypothetical protein
VSNLASLAAAPYCLKTVSIYKNSDHIYAFLGHLSSPLCLGSNSCFYDVSMLQVLDQMMIDIF